MAVNSPVADTGYVPIGVLTVSLVRSRPWPVGKATLPLTVSVPPPLGGFGPGEPPHETSSHSSGTTRYSAASIVFEFSCFM